MTFGGGRPKAVGVPGYGSAAGPVSVPAGTAWPAAAPGRCGRGRRGRRPEAKNQPDSRVVWSGSFPDRPHGISGFRFRFCCRDLTDSRTAVGQRQGAPPRLLRRCGRCLGGGEVRSLPLRPAGFAPSPPGRQVSCRSRRTGSPVQARQAACVAEVRAEEVWSRKDPLRTERDGGGRRGGCARAGGRTPAAGAACGQTVTSSLRTEIPHDADAGSGARVRGLEGERVEALAAECLVSREASGGGEVQA